MEKSPEGRAATAQWHYVKLDATSPDVAKACYGQPDLAGFDLGHSWPATGLPHR